MNEPKLRVSRGLTAMRLAARGGARYAASAPRLFAAAGERRQQLRDDLALRTAQEVAGEAAVVGCFVTRMDGTGTTLELRVRSPSPGERDSLRSRLLEQLSQRFAASGLDSKDGRRASFT